MKQFPLFMPLTSCLSFLFVVIGGVMAGSGIFIQQFFGSRDYKHLYQTHRFKLIAGLVFLVIALPLAFIFGHYVIEFYSRNNDNPGEILSLALRLHAFRHFVGFIPYVFTRHIRPPCAKQEKRWNLMLASAVAASLMLFSIISLYVLQKGVLGAAIATTIARSVELMTLLFICELKGFLNLKSLIKGFSVEKHLTRTIIRKSWPLLGNEIMWAGGMVLISMAYAQRSNVLSALSIVSTMGKYLHDYLPWLIGGDFCDGR